MIIKQTGRTNKNNLKFNFPPVVWFLILSVTGHAQSDTTYWKRGVKGTLTFTQVSLTNWSAGGNNSVSLNTYLSTFANYTKNRTIWNNNLESGYGLVDQGDLGIRKSDDKIIFTTKYGYKIKEDDDRFYWSTILDFKTQFNTGYKFSKDGTKKKISDFMAPGYLTIATGLEYKPAQHYNLLYAPVSGKITFVSSTLLSDQGAFGVTSGEGSFSELGSFLKINFKKDIAKNINLESKLELFTAYDDTFGNIDINWQNSLLMKINDWLSTSLITQLLYDDNVKIVKKSGTDVSVTDLSPKIQFKQIFGLALSHTIGDK